MLFRSLPTIRRRLSHQKDAYAAYWQKTLSSFPSSLTLHSILTALFSSLPDIPDRLDIRPATRALVKRDAVLLRDLVGRPTKDNAEILGAVCAIVLGREWNEGHARIFACWFSGAQKGRADSEGMQSFSLVPTALVDAGPKYWLSFCGKLSTCGLIRIISNTHYCLDIAVRPLLTHRIQ